MIDQATLEHWAEKRADDAGRLARELVKARAEVSTMRAAITRAFHACVTWQSMREDELEAACLEVLDALDAHADAEGE